MDNTNKNVWHVHNQSRASPFEWGDKSNIEKYFIENMFLKSLQMFEYKNLPKEIPQEVLEMQLQRVGYTTIFKHEGKLYATYGGLGGKLNYNYLPTISIVSNPYLMIQSKTLKIGEDCVVGRNDALYIGLSPTHSLYASQMVENLLTTRIATVNMRSEMVFTAPDDDIYKSIEEFYEGLLNGDLHAIMDNNFLAEVKSLPHTNSSSGRVLTQLIEQMQYVKAGWWNEMGVEANYNMKRESINSNESQLNDAMLMPFPDHMLYMRKKMCEEVNEMFGTNWKVDFGSVWKKKRTEVENELKMQEKELSNGEENPVDGKKDDGEENPVDGKVR